MYKLIGLVGAALFLAACGEEKKQETQTVDYDQLTVTPQWETPLILAKSDDLLERISNGIRLQTKSNAFYRTGALEAAASGAPTVDNNASADGFSDTNVHVSGVDESDVVKYDGEHWFIATQPIYEPYLIEQPQPGLRIVDTDPAVPSASHVADYPFDDGLGAASQLYLVAEKEKTSHVAVLRYQWGNIYPMLPGVPMDFAVSAISEKVVTDAGSGVVGTDAGGAAVESISVGGGVSAIAGKPAIWMEPQNSRVHIDLIEVTTPSAPKNNWSIDLDGSLIDSRKVGNTLYLVTRYEPWINQLAYEFGSEFVRSSNEELIKELTVEKAMPHYRIAGVEAPLTTDCYMQESPQDYYALSTLIHITAIDLAKQKIVGSNCINSNLESLSMSTSSLYLTGTYFDAKTQQSNTVIHKFTMAESGPVYSATGHVKGSLGWSSDPVFRMHEQGEQFRIVTSNRIDSNGPEHTLTILKQKGGVLETLSTLPNKARPDPIGKPGEDIYSVRFEKDRAYIVTFRRKDPLYSIDISNPSDPQIAGELVIPGFATYMHPLGDYLFTLGNDADDDGRVRGVKVELINIASDNPQVVSSLIIGVDGSYSPALHDLKAINFLAVSDDEVRIALPIVAYSKAQLGTQWDYSGIQLLVVDGLTSSAELRDAGAVKIAAKGQNQSSNTFNSTVRSVLHDDAVFVTMENKVWAANWYASKDIFGPVSGAGVDCDGDVRNGLSVEVNLPLSAQDSHACDAEVMAYNNDNGNKELLQAMDSKDPTRCTFVGAREKVGSYYIEASLNDLVGQEKTIVYRDQCHVRTEALKIDLRPSGTTKPLPCNSDIVELKPVFLSLIVRAEDGGIAACDSKVYVNQNGTIYSLEHDGQGGNSAASPIEIGDASVPVELVAPPPPTEYYCHYTGYGLVGDMVLYVENPNYEPFKTDLVVPTGECRIETQKLEVVLKPLVK